MRARWIIGPRSDVTWFLLPALSGYLLIYLNAVGFSSFLLWWFFNVTVNGPHFFATISRTYLDADEWRRRPALYALALEKLFPGARIEGGRLYYATYVGDFTSIPVALDAQARGSVHALAQTVREAIAQGFLPAAPRDQRECDRCDYLEVCGPSEWMRTQRKPAEALAPLVRLRGMP